MAWQGRFDLLQVAYPVSLPERPLLKRFANPGRVVLLLYGLNLFFPNPFDDVGIGFFPTPKFFNKERLWYVSKLWLRVVDLLVWRSEVILDPGFLCLFGPEVTRKQFDHR